MANNGDIEDEAFFDDADDDLDKASDVQDGENSNGGE